MTLLDILSLAAESAVSLPSIPECPEIHSKIIVLSQEFKALIIKILIQWSSLGFFKNWRALKLSVKITKLLRLDLIIYLIANKIAYNSALKIPQVEGSRFLTQYAEAT